MRKSFCSDCHSNFFFRKVVVYISFYTFFPVVHSGFKDINVISLFRGTIKNSTPIFMAIVSDASTHH